MHQFYVFIPFILRTIKHVGRTKVIHKTYLNALLTIKCVKYDIGCNRPTG